MAALTILDVIRTKRDGGELSDEAIVWFINNYTSGVIADEQASALLMAILFRGLNPRELGTWTRAMINTGIRMDLSSVDRPTVDKHSTGGVGDKITLPLCPLVAACGPAVSQLSGRGLGHTGGTLDKMESIPGWRANVAEAEYIEQLKTVGAVMCAAGADLAPADRKMYSLRDVTATVEAIPLIASSIMAKKIAGGADALVLDVKFGSGAFVPEIERGRELAEIMVGLGEAAGVRTAALLTNMNTPLGRTAGNGLEVTESVEVLEGGGPADVVELTIALAEVMCELAGVDADPGKKLRDGSAMDSWRLMVAAQGGDPNAVMRRAPHVETVTAGESAMLSSLDARKVGEAAWRLGAGRSRKEDAVSEAAGVVWHAVPGDTVEAGQVLFELHADDPQRIPDALEALEGAAEFGDSVVGELPLILERIG